ncbi:hypothetical protein C8R43DRAFT_442459 [Mycena crocata]|nr:hypothetical protein C8R43DRAFT_442459 [Mycena crocata]
MFLLPCILSTCQQIVLHQDFISSSQNPWVPRKSRREVANLLPRQAVIDWKLGGLGREHRRPDMPLNWVSSAECFNIPHRVRCFDLLSDFSVHLPFDRLISPSPSTRPDSWEALPLRTPTLAVIRRSSGVGNKYRLGCRLLRDSGSTLHICRLGVGAVDAPCFDSLLVPCRDCSDSPSRHRLISCSRSSFSLYATQFPASPFYPPTHTFCAVQSFHPG